MVTFVVSFPSVSSFAALLYHSSLFVQSVCIPPVPRWQSYFHSACECGGARVVVSLLIAHCQRSKVLVRLAVQEMQEIQPKGKWIKRIKPNG